MTRTFEVRILLLALLCLAAGFVTAERMAPAAAQQAAPVPAGVGSTSFPGTSGVTTITVDQNQFLLIVRDGRIWKLPVGVQGGEYRPWVKLAD